MCARHIKKGAHQAAVHKLAAAGMPAISIATCYGQPLVHPSNCYAKTLDAHHDLAIQTAHLQDCRAARHCRMAAQPCSKAQQLCQDNNSHPGAPTKVYAPCRTKQAPSSWQCNTMEHRCMIAACNRPNAMQAPRTPPSCCCCVWCLAPPALQAAGKQADASTLQGSHQSSCLRCRQPPLQQVALQGSSAQVMDSFACGYGLVRRCVLLLDSHTPSPLPCMQHAQQVMLPELCLRSKASTQSRDCTLCVAPPCSSSPWTACCKMQQLQMSMTMQPVLNRTGTAGSTTRAAVSNSMLYAIITQHAP